MVAFGILQNPSVRNWLGGIEPAWMLLDQASFAALQQQPSPTAGPIRLASDLTAEEVQQSAVARNARVFLRAAAAGAGLKMTATGNLSRGVVAEMVDAFTWPGFDKAAFFDFHKVVNEPDFLPLFFIRHIAAAGKLLRRHKGHLKATSAGQKLAEEPNLRALQAVLFHIALWRLNLDYLSRDLHHGWPQCDAGIVLWSLSIAADDWQPRERLTRLCTVPVNGVLDGRWDTTSYAMEAKILQPLQWFGLLDHRQEDMAGSRFAKQRFYRKTALFNRFLSFDVRLETAGAVRH